MKPYNKKSYNQSLLFKAIDEKPVDDWPAWKEYKTQATEKFGTQISFKTLFVCFKCKIPLPKRISGHPYKQDGCKIPGQIGYGKKADDHAINQGKQWQGWLKKNEYHQIERKTVYEHEKTYNKKYKQKEDQQYQHSFS